MGSPVDQQGGAKGGPIFAGHGVYYLKGYGADVVIRKQGKKFKGGGQRDSRVRLMATLQKATWEGMDILLARKGPWGGNVGNRQDESVEIQGFHS